MLRHLLIITAFMLLATTTCRALDGAFEIEKTIQDIKMEAPGESRYRLGASLNRLVVDAKNAGLITPSIIKQITFLLNEPDDSVRLWAALALGNIGAAAESAIPALEKVLRESEHHDLQQIKRPALGLTDIVRSAIQKIKSPN